MMERDRRRTRAYDVLVELDRSACSAANFLWQYAREVPEQAELAILTECLRRIKLAGEYLEEILPAEVPLPEPWKFERAPKRKIPFTELCKGLTKRGYNCKNRAQQGSLFCGNHQEHGFSTLAEILGLLPLSELAAKHDNGQEKMKPSE